MKLFRITTFKFSKIGREGGEKGGKGQGMEKGEVVREGGGG